MNSHSRLSPGTFHFLLCSAALLLSSVHGSAAEDARSARALFKNPTREYSTGPLWVWNDMLTDQEIKDTIRDLAEQKVKQVWVHPRPGLMTPYLSEQWFHLWDLTLKEAERLNMNVWIYDENSYPSGFAGGFVPEEMPESRGRGLSLQDSKSPPKWTPETIAVYRVAGDTIENISAKARANETLPEGSYVVAREVRTKDSPWTANRCYVNLLSPGVTEKFLDVTLEPYRRHLGRQFGNRVPGVFTDEPNIRPAGGLPWSEVLAEAFKKRWGYDLLDHLPSLAKPIGDWPRIRHNYYQVLNEQFIEHWSKPYHDYCEKHGLEWTGHYWDHEWPECVGVPDNMAMYAWHQRPAIDTLMNQYSEHTHGQFGNLRMCRELQSVANQMGARRTLCEVYGAGGWDLRFEDMKRIGDWLAVLGINTFNQHLSYVTLRGARKRDHPQSFSYHEPWWDAYHVSAEYLARLSAALSQGEQVNRVLVLEPTTSAWMYQGDGSKLGPLGDAFFKLCLALDKAQVEYDIGSEDIIARHGSVVPAAEVSAAVQSNSLAAKLGRRAELKVGKRSYAVVVLPPFTDNLNSRTAELLEQLLGASPAGEVVCASEATSRIDGAVSDRLRRLQMLPAWKQVPVEKIAPLLASSPYYANPGVYREPGDKGILFHHRRLLGDGQLLFLVNTSIEAPSAGQLRLGYGDLSAPEAQARSIEKWDPYTGEMSPYPFAQMEGGISADFKLPPSGSLLLFLSSKRRSPPTVLAESSATIEPASAPQIHRLSPNVLTLDYVDVSAAGETRTNLYFYQGNQFTWKQNGMDRNPWDSAVQFKDELISRKFPAESGFTVSYSFTLEGTVPSDLAVVVERPDLYTMTLNDKGVLATPGDWWLDKSFGRIPIASLAKPGKNTLRLKASPFTMYHELEPAYLLGSFGLRAADSGFVVEPEKPLQVVAEAGAAESSKAGWNSQGLPFYSGGVAYRERFNLSELSGHYRVFLPSWYGSVASVKVNGKLAGYIDAPPWECDVTRWLKRDANQIEVTVIGTLKNTLGPHHGNPPPGAAWPAGFQKAPASGPPPGSEYSTFSYGLFAPFVLHRPLPQAEGQAQAAKLSTPATR